MKVETFSYEVVLQPIKCHKNIKYCKIQGYCDMWIVSHCPVTISWRKCQLQRWQFSLSFWKPLKPSWQKKKTSLKSSSAIRETQLRKSGVLQKSKFTRKFSNKCHFIIVQRNKSMRHMVKYILIIVGCFFECFEFFLTM